MDIDALKRWIGRTNESRDQITPRLANSLAAVVDDPPTLAPGDAAPPGIHWCLSPDIAPMSGLGADGHPARGGFLPPVPLPRRMWAGGGLRGTGDFRVGDVVTRRSRILDVAAKTGRSGALCFVTVQHDHATPRGPALEERLNLVYRAIDAAPAPDPAPAPAPAPDLPEPEESHAVNATPVLLARYSAVTFNGHRIHYDRDYCREVEQYPGLLVHGPLQASLLLRLAIRLRGGTVPARFDFQGTAPLFDGAPFTVNGRREGAGHRLWVLSAAGVVTMRAQAA
jgi:3-methylfumaryl-CoA hydratase